MITLFKKKRASLALMDYHPRSQLVVEQTLVEKACLPVIDAHMHLGPRYPSEPFEQRYRPDQLVQTMQAAGVALGIDLELFSWGHFERVRQHIAGYENYFRFCAPVDLSHFENPDFERCTAQSIRQAAKLPCVCGIKVWKDLGLELRSRKGRLAKLTDACFAAIWQTAAETGLPVVLHVADPPAFFEPADRYNERVKELIRYPMWRYAQRHDVSFQGLLNQQETLVARYPDTRFVIAHLGSWACNLDYVESLLTRFPNVWVDLAAVLSEIGRQPRRFADFAEKFQDRILFGTDTFGGDPSVYPYYFRFLETYDEYFPYAPSEAETGGCWRIYGCGLPVSVLQKIYAENAKTVFHIA